MRQPQIGDLVIGMVYNDRPILRIYKIRAYSSYIMYFLKGCKNYDNGGGWTEAAFKVIGNFNSYYEKATKTYSRGYSNGS